MSVLPPEVAALVERFSRNRDAYRNPAYNEAQTRREFIDPLFKALGWDLDNVSGLAEAYKDVIHEDAIKVGGASKAPDYCFRIGGTRKFFVEAKKPAVGLETDPEPAYQLRRYAWTSKLPLSILTDFEEFAVYDCRIPPKVADRPSVARVFYATCDEYADHWDYIAGLFSKDAVLKGAFDKYAESTKRKKGTAEVDAEFLKQIEAWRLALAQNLALRNPQLSVRDLNFAVQRTIDRLIFLRMCEDRGIEIYGGLQALLNGDHAYERLAVLFRQADDKYNSGLFYFTAEAGREPPDTLTLDLTLDDKVLKDIIKSLYYPESPYEFSVLPPEVLGQVYEQFLGKVIRLTAGHHAKVEEKPEVRKAGGVYYTPAYIVDYIVKNTVGKLLEERVPGLGARGPGLGARDQGLGARGPGLGARDQGLGARGSGDKAHGDQTLPRPGGMAEGDGPRGTGLPDRESAAGRGALRTDQPDSAGGGVDTRERGGGAQPDAPGRLPPSSLDGARLAGGTGNAPDIGGPPRSAGPGGGPPDLGVVPARRPAPERAHRRPAENGTRDSGSGTRDRGPGRRRRGPRAPSPQPLTPIPGPLRILDPACGSGSFLLGAYQFLLNWHRDWYVSGSGVRGSGLGVGGPGSGVRGSGFGSRVPGPESRVPGPESRVPGPESRVPDPDFSDRIYQGPGGQWLLTIQEKKRILLNHIYGVDIDPQAVEVTKLSLLLKVLEGETEQTIGSTLRLFHERALPDLDKNIKCGNSLIGPDFYDNQQMSLFDEDERLRINAFDWAAEFPEVFGTRDSGPGTRTPSPGPRTPSPESRAPGPASGFDAVIGNPPYIRMEAFKALKDYLRAHYHVHDERTDLYAYFIEREHDLLREGGRFGMIVSNKFLRANYGQKVRERMATVGSVERIVDLAGLPVFHGATVRTIVLITAKGQTGADALYSPPPARDAFLTLEGNTRTLTEVCDPLAYPIAQREFSATEWRLAGREAAVLIDRLRAGGRRLFDVVHGRICRGVVSGLTAAFVITDEERHRILAVNPKAREIIRPFVQGRNIRRYYLERTDSYLIYTHHGIDMTPYPAVLEHLRPFRKQLEKRATKQEWYELQQPQLAYKQLLEQPKIVFPDIATECRFTIDHLGHFGANTVYFLPTDDLFLLGILNSRLAYFYFAQTCAGLEGSGRTYLRFFGQYLESFPVPAIDRTAQSTHDRLVALVQQMLDLHKELGAANTPAAQTALQRQIEATDRQIDQVVYELYGLTEEEIRIVEEATQ
jgi:hypothetical protein